MIHKAIIIGGGPAGYTAAIYLARARLAPLCIEGLEYGGQLMTTTDIENYPGFDSGIGGAVLMDRFRKQAERFGTELRSRDVTRVELSEDGGLHKVWVDDDAYEAHAIVIATGAGPRRLGLESESRLWGKGVSSCATCDGAFFRDKVVCVIGGGDSAVEEASFLTRFASKVYVIHRRDELRASKIMRERLLANDKVEVLWSRVPVEILGDERVEGVRLKSTKTGETEVVELQGFFLGIGHIPNTAMFKGTLALDEAGYLVPESGVSMAVPGVFAAGDCVDHHYQQAITAAAMGCQAAIDCERWLEAKSL